MRTALTPTQKAVLAELRRGGFLQVTDPSDNAVSYAVLLHTADDDVCQLRNIHTMLRLLRRGLIARDADFPREPGARDLCGIYDAV